MRFQKKNAYTSTSTKIQNRILPNWKVSKLPNSDHVYGETNWQIT